MGEFIRTRRLGELLTIKEVARLTGVSASHISRIERSERKPSKSVIERLATVLPIDDLPFPEYADQPFDLDRIRTLPLRVAGKPAPESLREEIIRVLDQHHQK